MQFTSSLSSYIPSLKTMPCILFKLYKILLKTKGNNSKNTLGRVIVLVSWWWTFVPIYFKIPWSMMKLCSWHNILSNNLTFDLVVTLTLNALRKEKVMHNLHVAIYAHAKFHPPSMNSILVIAGKILRTDGQTDGLTDGRRVNLKSPPVTYR